MAVIQFETRFKKADQTRIPEPSQTTNSFHNEATKDTTMATMNMILTPHFYDQNPWSKGNEHQPYVALGLSASDGLWDVTAGNNKDASAWNQMPKHEPSPLIMNTEPPKEVYIYSTHWQDDDDVSLLNDDPDEDDVQVLPQSTYNVLAPLFDEIYVDESEYDDDAAEDVDALFENSSEPIDKGVGCGEGARAA